MPVNPGFRDYVLEQLTRIIPTPRARPMFGGVSINGPEGTFALIDDDVLYLKGDKHSRERYEGAGWAPFRPFGATGSTMAYFEVPPELLEDTDALLPWVELARDAAARVKRPRKG